MKIAFLLLIAIASMNGFTQNIYKCKNGKVSFFSSAPLEDIEARSDKVSALLNSTTGEVAVLMPIESFEFSNKLMKEHFNENYLESDKYPKATFSGKISDAVNVEKGKEQAVMVSGDLNIHGVTVKRSLPIVLKYIETGKISASGKFMIKVADHDVKIPKLMFKKIAEEVEVEFELILSEN